MHQNKEPVCSIYSTPLRRRELTLFPSLEQHALYEGHPKDVASASLGLCVERKFRLYALDRDERKR